MKNLFVYLLLFAFAFTNLSEYPEPNQVHAQTPPPDPTDPYLTIADVTGKAQKFITVRSQTNCSVVKYFAVSPELDVFPADLLASKTSTVIVADTSGIFTMGAYTGKGDKLTDPVFFKVYVDTTPPDPNNPPVIPPVIPPVVPPVVPPAPPTIPEDRFDNVGRAVYTVVTGFPNDAKAQAADTAKLFDTTADSLASGQLATVNAAAAFIQSERTKLWGPQAATWAPFVATLNVPWQARWPLSKTDVIEFYRAASVGLKAVK